ncbi:MAG: Type 1 glutamine amidotransferase-like domain-containing protein [Candidatus Eisenbacteria bacterium]
MRQITLLGPQRLEPTLIQAVRDQNITGRIATVTAGWQEREDEDRELHEHLESRTRNLRLYDRVSRIFEHDPGLRDAFRARQDRLKELQRFYRIRLDHVLQAARELVAIDEESDLLEGHLASAIRDLQLLDEEHLENVRRIHEHYEHEVDPGGRDEVRRQRDEVRAALADCDALAIAGGHVAILLNRLRLLDIPNACAGKPLFLWSAGAMAMSERIVLFHDSPPQGQGNPEVLEAGLGVVEGVVPLPHARRRLRLYDRSRVALFARRFSPATCVTLDEGSRVDMTDTGWESTKGTRKLLETGEVKELSA